MKRISGTARPYVSGVILSAQGWIITAMEKNRRTVLHEDVTYVILQMIEILHVLCLSLSSHYGFKFSSSRVQFVHANLLYKRYHTTAGFKSVSQYTA